MIEGIFRLSLFLNRILYYMTLSPQKSEDLKIDKERWFDLRFCEE